MQEFLLNKFELSRGGSGHNVHAMEGLRGFAVGLVFLVHYVTLAKPWVSDPSTLALARAIHSIGNTGVDLFFVLSGYLIYGALIARPQMFFKFMSRRIVRIYPAFTAVFVLYLGLSFVFPTESKIPSSLFQRIVYLAENFLLLPGLFPIEPMITVAWSLSYEMFYYFAIPIIITSFKLRTRSSAWRSWFFSLVAIGVAVYCGAFGGHIRLMMFISGILLYETISRRRTLPNAGLVGLLALSAGLLAPLLPMGGTAGLAFKFSLISGSFFLLCLDCFCNSSARFATAFAWRPLRWLGNMSYSYYLLHGLALKAAFLVFASVLPMTTHHGDWVFWGLLPLMFAITLIPTAALFLAIEHPFSLAPARSNMAGPGVLSGVPVKS